MSNDFETIRELARSSEFAHELTDADIPEGIERDLLNLAHVSSRTRALGSQFREFHSLTSELMDYSAPLSRYDAEGTTSEQLPDVVRRCVEDNFDTINSFTTRLLTDTEVYVSPVASSFAFLLGSSDSDDSIDLIYEKYRSKGGTGDLHFMNIVLQLSEHSGRSFLSSTPMDQVEMASDSAEAVRLIAVMDSNDLAGAIAESPDIKMLAFKLKRSQTIRLADIVTFIKNVDDHNIIRLLPKQRQRGEDARELAEIDLLDALIDKSTNNESIVALFKKIKLPHKGQEADESSTFNHVKRTLHGLYDTNSLLSRLADSSYTFLDDLQQESDEFVANYDASVRETIALTRHILERTVEKLSVTNTVTAALGALAVEKVMIDLSKYIFDKSDNNDVSKSTMGIIIEDIPDSLHNQINTLEAQDRQAAELAKRNEIYDQIQRIEGSLIISAKRLRELNGLELRRKISDYKYNGNDRPVFGVADAQSLAGLMLQYTEHGYIRLSDDTLKDISNIRDLWADMSLISDRNQIKRSGFIKTTGKLLEWRDGLTSKEIASLDNSIKSLVEVADQISLTLNSAPKPDRQNELDAVFSNLEPIEPFPPGASDQDIKDDLRRFADGSEYDIEWRRIDDLLAAKSELEHKGYVVTTYRLLQSSWHPLPHYVLQVVGEGADNEESMTTIIESPIYGNATYSIRLGSIGKEVVTYSKQEVRDRFGGVVKVHNPDSPVSHKSKIIELVES
ncbi:MAG: hypothetical protein ABI354_02375 [Candidatus Saccharimonadales bacterium]